jgi:hypothetical protein
MTKQLIASILILGLVGMVVGVVAQGAETASVAATVTVQNISVTVSDGTVAYGTLPVNTTKSTLVGELNDLQTATNNGNVTENFNIKGQNSANWTLAASAGADQYVHKFSKDSGVSWTALTTSYATLATGIAALGTQTFDLQITTPTSSTNYTQQSVDVTVQAVAG